MSYQTLLLHEEGRILKVTINRPEARNAINGVLTTELIDVFNRVGQQKQYRMVILQGQNGFFCTGMDFKAVTEGQQQEFSSDAYMNLLRTMAMAPCIIISAVDGIAMAGGIGIVAASDLVFATPKSQFTLSEALWGLLPCCVTPYLIRRVGFHIAYKMTLTTQTLSAEQARSVHLVDEMTENLDEDIRRQSLRLNRLDPQTLADMKQYFRDMWIVNEHMENKAVHEISRLMSTDRIHQNIVNYVQHGKFPWDQ